jgi:uncharacterized repeat protein (TIGR04138 family)
MTGNNFHEVVQLIRKEDGRYQAGAYVLVRQALDFTINRIRKQEGRARERHISGSELCAGLRDFVLEQYGPMAFALLAEYGIHRTEDIGQIVFNLVEFGVFGKTEKDSLEDFSDGFDFRAALLSPFEPQSKAHQETTPATSIPTPS